MFEPIPPPVLQPQTLLYERIEWGEWPRSDSYRATWCAWLRAHTIDPNDVLCPGWIERHPAARQIRYETVELDEAGRLVKLGDDVSRVTRVVQLEAEPAEFPEVR
jgi:hypothetical protein